MVGPTTTAAPITTVAAPTTAAPITTAALTTTAASPTTAASHTTAAPTPAAALMTTAAPTTTAALTTTGAPTTTAALTKSTVPTTTAATTTTAALTKMTAPTTSAAPTTTTTTAASTTTTIVLTTTTAASTGPPLGNEGVQNLFFRIIRPFVDELLNPSSPEFQDLARLIVTQLNRAYRRRYPRTYRRCRVRGLRRGRPLSTVVNRMDTILVDTELIFVNQSVVANVTEIETALQEAIDDSTVDLNIIPSSINAAATNTSTPATTSSAMATNKPQEVITFLFPLYLVIYFLSADMRLPHIFCQINK
ncbi:uncharacterized protein LOC133115424 isoform X1 [Conger conger]|uniref:uncharacterized protein LOC133115424 isoform X1 n=1 Tax=Conger conger TaxID=82655 RepID=UPI002A5A9776|nr:uncharacterized protein LOC133115424 isoform X1 [Conger conger]